MAYNPLTIITTTAAYANTLGPGAIFAQVTGYGTLRVSNEPGTLLYDPFDTFDTVNTWNTATQVNSATVTQGSGGITLVGGTTGSAIASIDSRPSFTGNVPAFLQISFAVKLESVATTTTPYTATASRFWGVGTPGGGTFTTPTTTTPLANAVGWEIDATTGHLLAVVYNAGVRTTIADVTTDGNIKNDGAYHRYLFQSRTDRVYWYIDSLDTPIAISNFNFPAVQTLPVRMHIVNRPATPTTTSLICTGVAVADTGSSQVFLSDGTYSWRKGKINTAGALSVTGTGTAGSADTTVITVQGISGGVAQPISGDVASGSADSGNPIKMGGVGRTTNPTAVTDGQRANIMLDKLGRQIVVNNQVRDLVVRQATTLTVTGATTVLSAQGAGVFADITLISITNSSATATIATISDGTLSFGVAIAANGGAVIPFNTPLTATTANTAWTIALSVAVTDIRCLVQAVKNL